MRNASSSRAGRYVRWAKKGRDLPLDGHEIKEASGAEGLGRQHRKRFLTERSRKADFIELTSKRNAIGRGG